MERVKFRCEFCKNCIKFWNRQTDNYYGRCMKSNDIVDIADISDCPMINLDDPGCNDWEPKEDFKDE